MSKKDLQKEIIGTLAVERHKLEELEHALKSNERNWERLHRQIDLAEERIETLTKELEGLSENEKD